MTKTPVTLAYPYTDEAGKNHNPDTTISLDADIAAQLISDGKARTADKTAEPSTPKEK